MNLTSKPLSRRQVLLGALPAGLALTVPARAAPPALPFVVIGDWGRRGADHQAEVGRQMGETAASIASRFVISVGDNFYENGVQSLDDTHWRQSFEAIYTAPALQTPWYVILGNHDYRGEIAPQLAYHSKSPRWRMPARYFSRTETLADGSAADLFFIDTSPFIRAYRGSAVRIDDQDPAAQLAWLDQALGASTAPWKIVIGHHPLYTALGGAHHDQPDLIAPLAPLLRRHHVPVYINGHDHSMQYVEMDGIAYVTTGAGSETYETGPANRPGFAAGAHGFLRAALRPEVLEIAFVTETGAIPFSRVIPRTPG